LINFPANEAITQILSATVCAGELPARWTGLCGYGKDTGTGGLHALPVGGKWRQIPDTQFLQKIFSASTHYKKRKQG
jgi:hypothetical protein